MYLCRTTRFESSGPMGLQIMTTLLTTVRIVERLPLIFSISSPFNRICPCKHFVFGWMNSFNILINKKYKLYVPWFSYQKWRAVSTITLPANDTIYYCSFHKGPVLDKKHHIVGVNTSTLSTGQYFLCYGQFL